VHNIPSNWCWITKPFYYLLLDIQTLKIFVHDVFFFNHFPKVHFQLKFNRSTKFNRKSLKYTILTGCQWLMSVILATQVAETRRIKVQGQPRQNSSQDPISKYPFTKKGWWSGSRCRPWVQTPVWEKKKIQFSESEVERTKYRHQVKECHFRVGGLSLEVPLYLCPCLLPASVSEKRLSSCRSKN
jgi:hypothetical protein